MKPEDYKIGIVNAVEKDHPCEDNSCDIAAALRAGFPLSAAHLLLGATDCPTVEKFLEENGPISTIEDWPRIGTSGQSGLRTIPCIAKNATLTTLRFREL